MRAVVCLKQVIDPLTPATSLVLDAQGKKIRAGVAAPPVINGFDEQGIEAALRLRETIKDLEIVCVAVGERFNNDVMKRALAVGADQLILVQDPSLDTWNSYPIASALAKRLSVTDGKRVVVERVLADGSVTMEADLPVVVTVTSELGALRMPSVAAR